jgi:hypothetical protein
MAWHRPAVPAPAPGLGPGSDGPSLGRLAWARRRTEHGRVRQGTKAGMVCAVGDGGDRVGWAEKGVALFFFFEKWTNERRLIRQSA